jgi:hypothetical protein
VHGSAGLLPVGDGSMAPAGVERRRDVVALAPGGVVNGSGARVLGPAGLSAGAVEEVQR